MRENSYQITLLTDAHDEDYNRHIRPSAILRYMQIAANMQLHTYGPTTEEMLARGQAFILSAIDLTFHAPVSSYETIVSETWPCEAKGFAMPRCYALHNNTGEEIARGYSLWAVIDIQKRTLIRANEVPLPFPTLPAFDTKPQRFTMPHINEMEQVGTYAVTYAQTDLNHHLNNTHYPDMFANFLSLEKKRITHIGIRFIKEAPLGECLTIYKHQNGDIYHFFSLRQDGEVNAEAEFTLTDL